MRCEILHESSGRIRVHIIKKQMTLNEADKLQYYLLSFDWVRDVKVYDSTCDAVIVYSGSRSLVIKTLASFSFETTAVSVPDHTGRELNKGYEEKILFTTLWHGFKRIFFPWWLRAIINGIKAVRYVYHGLNSLLHGRLDVHVLDATSITVSMLLGDYSTAGSVMFLLKIGDILEEWTHKKSVDDLARTMSLNIEKAWLRVDGTGVLTSINNIHVGDLIVVRTGGLIPLDGRVVEGEAMVNQSSMTGESLPVHKETGSYVYAGTAVEEGECVISVDKSFGSGRYDRIVSMIEDSEKLKSDLENKASNLADGLVPYSLGATGLVYLLTQNVTKAQSVLMVDFSCALKLVMPITVLSAMREAGKRGMTVKGGRFLEHLAQADTIVFDKTGTLTHAQPKVVSITPFGGHEEKEMLRVAACLEEHYPHSMANAVVQEALDRGITHKEMHSNDAYILAHGISSEMNDGKRVIIGSYHFIFEDEGVVIPEGEQEKFDSLPGEYSHLFMAIGSELAAVICIEDPLREEARDVVRQLKCLGISKVVMMTGDSGRIARAVAAKVGVDECYSEVLPEDKAAFVIKEEEAGRKVIMVGDGVNDSVALSEADVGIAISDGAAIAREIADITITSDNLYSLVTLRRLSMVLMSRINASYRRIIGFNFALIVLGVAGILTPSVSALLHNASTVLFGLYGMTNLLPEDDPK